MGHSSINVAVDFYGHLVLGGSWQAVDKLEDTAPRVTRKTA
jgi:hypothetical protein